MGQLILHLNGAYNLYSTIADGPCYESALTLDELHEVIKEEGGRRALEELPRRLERAHQTGCSCGYGTSLEQKIISNRAGPNETHMASDEFILRFLTLPAKDSNV